MKQDGRLIADGTSHATAGPDWRRDQLGHPDLRLFDEIRILLAKAGLPPDPDTYELLHLHVSGSHAALSRDITVALAESRLDMAQVKNLRAIHLGDLEASEIRELAEEAEIGAQRALGHLETGRTELALHDKALAAAEELLTEAFAKPLADVVDDLRRVNSRMLTANRRLEAGVEATTLILRKLMERLESAERNACTDPLTGLLNRRGLADALAKAMRNALAHGTPLALGLIDLDNFHMVNERWGHPIGDEALRCISNHLVQFATMTAGTDAFAARLGGDEFVVALPALGVGPAAAALDQARAALVRQKLCRTSDGAPLGRISFSAGVALFRIEDLPEDLIGRADTALFAAKRAGRDRVVPEQS